MTLKELEQQARALSPEERAKLAEALLDSLRDAPVAEIEAAWEREIELRAAAYDRGASNCSTGGGGAFRRGLGSGAETKVRSHRRGLLLLFWVRSFTKLNPDWGLGFRSLL